METVKRIYQVRLIQVLLNELLEQTLLTEKWDDLLNLLVNKSSILPYFNSAFTILFTVKAESLIK
jgi:hypothetical protein